MDLCNERASKAIEALRGRINISVWSRINLMMDPGVQLREDHKGSVFRSAKASQGDKMTKQNRQAKSPGTVIPALWEPE